MNFRTRIIVAIAFVLALVITATSGIAINKQIQADEARIAAEQDRKGQEAALRIDGELTAIAVAADEAAIAIMDGDDPVRALDRLMAAAPLLRATSDGVTRPPSAQALMPGTDGFRNGEGYLWQSSHEDIVVIVEIRPDILDQHVWSAQEMPGATTCDLDGPGRHFPTARGPTITCQIGDAGSANSILVGGGLTAGLVFALGLGVAVFASVRLARPVHSIRLAVNEIQQGNLDARAEESGPLDMRKLASDVNSMAARLATDRRRLERFNEDLQAMVAARTRQLEESKESQAQFFYGLSHDFKAPLRSINGFAGLLDRALKKGDVEGAQRMLEKVQRSSSAMTHLVLQLLDFANADTDVPKPTKTDIRGLLRHIEDETIRPDGVTLTTSSTRKYGDVDAAIVERIVRNLVSNAIQHRPERPVNVTVRASIDDDHIQIKVQDDGDGIPAEIADNLFKPFVRGDHSGSGLGLAIVRRLARAHGGDVRVDSAPGRGATFTVHLKENP